MHLKRCIRSTVQRLHVCCLRGSWTKLLEPEIEVSKQWLSFTEGTPAPTRLMYKASALLHDNLFVQGRSSCALLPPRGPEPQRISDKRVINDFLGSIRVRGSSRTRSFCSRSASLRSFISLRSSSDLLPSNSCFYPRPFKIDRIARHPSSPFCDWSANVTHRVPIFRHRHLLSLTWYHHTSQCIV